jgi:hypothetical protein
VDGPALHGDLGGLHRDPAASGVPHGRRWYGAGVQCLANLGDADVEEPAVGPADRQSVLIEHRLIRRHGLLGEAMAKLVRDDPDGVVGPGGHRDRSTRLVAGSTQAGDDRGIASRLRAAPDGDALPAAGRGCRPRAVDTQLPGAEIGAGARRRQHPMCRGVHRVRGGDEEHLAHRRDPAERRFDIGEAGEWRWLPG